MVYAFLSAFLIAGVLGVELWPLTGWRLFSRVRHARAVSWQAVAVDRSGAEIPVPFRQFPRGYGGSLHVLKGFGALDRAGQEAVCRTWSRGLESLGIAGDQIRLYQVHVDRSIRLGDRRAGPSRKELRYVCRDGAVEYTGGAS